MDLVQTFVLDGTSYEVGTIWRDGDPLYKASDIAKVLGIRNIHGTLASIPECHKVLASSDTLGGNQQMVFLREKAVYKIIMRSRKPVAEPFQEWLSSIARDIRKRKQDEYEINLKQARDVAENLRWEAESLRREADISRLKASQDKHDVFVNTLRGPDRPVVYFGIIEITEDAGGYHTETTEEDSSQTRHTQQHRTRRIIKLGHTSDVFQRAYQIRHEYGNFYFQEVLECPGCVDLESYLKKHDHFLQHAYTGPIYHGRTSTETYSFDDEAYEKAISIAKRNRVHFTEKKCKKDRFRRTTAKISNQTSFENDIVHGVRDPSSMPQQTVEQRPVPTQSNPTEVVYLFPEERRYNQNRGPKVQRYSADGRVLLKTYPGFADASRDPKLANPVDHVIKKAAANKTVYKGYRWAELDRQEDDRTFQHIGDTVEMPTQKKGLVAMISLDRTHIVRVFGDQKEASENRRFKTCAAISKAIKDDSVSGGHYFKMWFDCPDDLKKEYFERMQTLPNPRVRSNASQVQQLHPMTNKVVATYSSVAHLMKNIKISRDSLYRAIDGAYIKNGYYWRKTGCDASSTTDVDPAGVWTDDTSRRPSSSIPI